MNAITTMELFRSFFKTQITNHKSQINNRDIELKQNEEVLSQRPQSLTSPASTSTFEEPTQTLLTVSNAPPPTSQQSNSFREQYQPNFPAYPQYAYDETILPLHAIQQAGLRIGQAQDLNYLVAKSQIELNRKNEELQMEFNHFWAMQNLKSSFQPMPEATISMANNSFSDDRLSQIIDEFIEKIKIVQDFENTPDNRIVSVYIWHEDKYNRHFNFTETHLIGRFKKWLYFKLKEKIEDISSRTVERLMLKLKHKIPELEKSNLLQLNESQIRFKNAVYDLTTGNFQSCDSSANIFNRFSIPIEVKNYEPPIVFDKLLDDITGGNALIKQLIYEIIGAVL